MQVSKKGNLKKSKKWNSSKKGGGGEKATFYSILPEFPLFHFLETLEGLNIFVIEPVEASTCLERKGRTIYRRIDGITD